MAESCPTVQRTLVKSPPELWAELSDPESLARRLSDFGEIRITRLVPETTVAWEGERASGTVELESSGWGTKVRLTARASTTATPVSARDRIVAVIESDDPQAEANAEPAPAASATDDTPSDGSTAGTDPPGTRTRISSAAERSAARMARRAAEAAAAAVVEAPPPPPPEPAAAGLAPAASPGFFARLFRRRKHSAAVAPVAPAVNTADPDPSPGPTAAEVALPSPPRGRTGRDEEQTLPHATLARPLPLGESARYAAPMSGSSAPTRATSPSAGQQPAATAPPATAPAAERTPASGLDPERTMALLSGVLDDLGSAHHRPFSRE